MKYIVLIFTFLLFSCTEEIQENKTGLAPEQKQIILALGDSLTAGYSVEESENYPSKLQKILDDSLYNYEVINAGVSGDTSANVLSRAPLYLEKNPSIVILVVGGNDGLRGLSTEDLKQNILQIIDSFPKSKIVLGGMDIPVNLGIAYRNEFRNVYKEIAKERKDIYFLEYFLDGVAGKSELNISDMIHPNSEGYNIIVKNLVEFLDKNKLIIK